jgi:hypothetical protein
MSPWVEVERSDGTGPDTTATIMRAAIAFSAHFVRSSPDVLNARWVNLFVDDDSRRLGFRFSDKPLKNALSLTPNGRKRNTYGRVVQTQALFTRYSWLRAISECRELKPRRFRVTWDSVEKLYFVALRPSFERGATTPSEVPSTAIGIYRYLRGADVVYIGQGDIRSRAKQDHRGNWVFDKIEYSLVADSSERFKFESYWLEEHRRKYGRLPEYNRIGGR